MAAWGCDGVLDACDLQEALLRVAAVLAHYGATRILSDSQQPLFAGTCRAATKVPPPR